MGCASATPTHPLPTLPRLPPDEVVVRTTNFVFHMGVRVDEAWATEAEEARAALGSALGVLLDEEDSVVPTLARQLGVPWPGEALDFDVSFRGERDDGPCDSSVPRRLYVATSRAAPAQFFACVLNRSFVRLAGESAVYRAILATLEQHGDVTAQASERLHACFVRYAVASVVLAGSLDKRVARENRTRRRRALPDSGAQLAGKRVESSVCERTRGPQRSGSARRARWACPRTPRPPGSGQPGRGFFARS